MNESSTQGITNSRNPSICQFFKKVIREELKDGKEYTKRFDALNGYGKGSSGPLCLKSALNIALLVIACVAAAGVFTNPNLGWIIVALAGSSFAITFYLGNLKQRKWKVLSSALLVSIIVTLGFLGGFHVLSNTQVGGAVAASFVAVMCLRFIYNCSNKETRSAMTDFVAQRWQRFQERRAELHQMYSYNRA